MFLKNKNIIFKIRRSKVTDYAALIELSLTAKAATLIFISGRCSAFSYAKEGKSALFIIW